MRPKSRLILTVVVSACAVPALADEQADARTLIDRAIRAAGGEERVARLQAVTWKTRVTVPGEKLSYSDESSAQGLDQYRSEITVNNDGRVVTAVQVLDRDKGWFRERGKTIDAPADFLGPRKEVYYFLRLPQMLLPLRDKEYKLSPLGEIKVGERSAVGVRVERAGHADLGVFFDKETGLLVKSEARLKLPDDREVVVAWLVRDHKEIDGLKHFTRFTLVIEGETFFDGEVSGLHAVGTLDAAVFVKP